MAPVIDGHVHLLGEDPEDYVTALLRAMDRNRVEQAVVFGVQGDPNCPDSLALSAHQRWPDRFAPFTCAFGAAAPGAAEALDKRLSAEPWRGVGEVFAATDSPRAVYRLRNGEEREHCYAVPAGGALDSEFGELFEVAAEHHVPVLLHCDDAPALEAILSRHPRAKVIWAHADWSAGLAPRLLATYPGLLYEVGPWLHFGALEQPEAPWVSDWIATWPPLLEQFAGRIVFGSDQFEWRHLEPEQNADAAYTSVARVAARLSPWGRDEWLGGALMRALAG